MPQSSTEDDQHDREGTHCIPRRLVTTSDQFATADGTFLSGTPCALTDRCSGLIFGFEIEFDLDAVGVEKENLPTDAIGHFVHAVGHAPLQSALMARR